MPIHQVWSRNTCLIVQRNELELREKYTIPKDVKIMGTGFLLSYKRKVILVTAKHVVKDRTKVMYCLIYESKNDGIIKSALNDIDTIQNRYNLKWHYHDDPDVDLAITIAEAPTDYFTIDERSWIPFDELKSGSGLSFLGFPLGLIPFDDLTPILKKASISRKLHKDTLFPIGRGDVRRFPSKTILIDGYIDRGNSGSPVIQEASVSTFNYNGEIRKIKDREGLIGFATSHFTTGYGNAGLGICVLVDRLKDLLEDETFKEEF